MGVGGTQATAPACSLRTLASFSALESLRFYIHSTCNPIGLTVLKMPSYLELLLCTIAAPVCLELDSRVSLLLFVRDRSCNPADYMKSCPRTFVEHHVLQQSTGLRCCMTL